jgi:hypothetical protein
MQDRSDLVGAREPKDLSGSGRSSLPRRRTRRDHQGVALHMRSAHAGSKQPLPAAARVVIGLEIFLGVGALFGGAALILGPDGHLIGMPTKGLAGSPFDSFLIPGIVLFTVVGLGPLGAAVLTLRRHAMASRAAIAVGVVLICWITVEMLVLAGPASLAWAFYLVLGTCIAAIGAAWLRGNGGSQ